MNKDIFSADYYNNLKDINNVLEVPALSNSVPLVILPKFSTVIPMPRITAQNSTKYMVHIDAQYDNSKNLYPLDQLDELNRLFPHWMKATRVARTAIYHIAPLLWNGNDAYYFEPLYGNSEWYGYLVKKVDCTYLPILKDVHSGLCDKCIKKGEYTLSHEEVMEYIVNRK